MARTRTPSFTPPPRRNIIVVNPFTGRVQSKEGESRLSPAEQARRATKFAAFSGSTVQKESAARIVQNAENKGAISKTEANILKQKIRDTIRPRPVDTRQNISTRGRTLTEAEKTAAIRQAFFGKKNQSTDIKIIEEQLQQSFTPDRRKEILEDTGTLQRLKKIIRDRKKAQEDKRAREIFFPKNQSVSIAAIEENFQQSFSPELRRAIREDPMLADRFIRESRKKLDSKRRDTLNLLPVDRKDLSKGFKTIKDFQTIKPTDTQKRFFKLLDKEQAGFKRLDTLKRSIGLGTVDNETAFKTFAPNFIKKILAFPLDLGAGYANLLQRIIAISTEGVLNPKATAKGLFTATKNVPKTLVRTYDLTTSTGLANAVITILLLSQALKTPKPVTGKITQQVKPVGKFLVHKRIFNFKSGGKTVSGTQTGKINLRKLKPGNNAVTVKTVLKVANKKTITTTGKINIKIPKLKTIIKSLSKDARADRLITKSVKRISRASIKKLNKQLRLNKGSLKSRIIKGGSKFKLKTKAAAKATAKNIRNEFIKLKQAANKTKATVNKVIDKLKARVNTIKSKSLKEQIKLEIKKIENQLSKLRLQRARLISKISKDIAKGKIAFKTNFNLLKLKQLNQRIANITKDFGGKLKSRIIKGGSKFKLKTKAVAKATAKNIRNEFIKLKQAAKLKTKATVNKVIDKLKARVDTIKLKSLRKQIKLDIKKIRNQLSTLRLQRAKLISKISKDIAKGKITSKTKVNLSKLNQLNQRIANISNDFVGKYSKFNLKKPVMVKPGQAKTIKPQNITRRSVIAESARRLARQQKRINLKRISKSARPQKITQNGQSFYADLAKDGTLLKFKTWKQYRRYLGRTYGGLRNSNGLINNAKAFVKASRITRAIKKLLARKNKIGKTQSVVDIKKGKPVIVNKNTVNTAKATQRVRDFGAELIKKEAALTEKFGKAIKNANSNNQKTQLIQKARSVVKRIRTKSSKWNRISKVTSNVKMSSIANSIAKGLHVVAFNLDKSIKKNILIPSQKQEQKQDQKIEQEQIIIQNQIIVPASDQIKVPDTTTTRIVKQIIDTSSDIVTTSTSILLFGSLLQPPPTRIKITKGVENQFIGFSFRNIARGKGRKFIYIPDLISSMFGFKASKREAKRLLQPGRVFTGTEIRRIV